MYQVLTILIVILSVFLVLIVLVQNSKGGGLTSNFASSNQIMGVRKTTDFLEKTTWGIVAVIVVLCVAATAFHKTTGVSSTSELSDRIEVPTEVPAGNFEDIAPVEIPAEAADAPVAE